MADRSPMTSGSWPYSLRRRARCSTALRAMASVSSTRLFSENASRLTWRARDSFCRSLTTSRIRSTPMRHCWNMSSSEARGLDGSPSASGCAVGAAGVAAAGSVPDASAISWRISSIAISTFIDT